MSILEAIKKSIVDVEELLAEYPRFEGVYPFPVNIMAEDLGYSIVPISTRNYNMESSFSGGVSLSKKKIYVSISDSTPRRRFTIAHEIAHIRLHQHEVRANKDPFYDPNITYEIPGQMINFYRKGAFPVYSEIEHEANAFAGELLMPFNQFRERYYQLKEESYSERQILDLLTHYYETSRQATIYRIDLVNRLSRSL